MLRAARARYAALASVAFFLPFQAGCQIVVPSVRNDGPVPAACGAPADSWETEAPEQGHPLPVMPHAKFHPVPTRPVFESAFESCRTSVSEGSGAPTEPPTPQRTRPSAKEGAEPEAIHVPPSPKPLDQPDSPLRETGVSAEHAPPRSYPVLIPPRSDTPSDPASPAGGLLRSSHSEPVRRAASIRWVDPG